MPAFFISFFENAYKKNSGSMNRRFLQGAYAFCQAFTLSAARRLMVSSV